MDRCPICGSKKYTYIDTICTNMKIMGNSFISGDVDLVTCGDCGCVFLNSENTEEAYLGYYTSDYSKAPRYYEMFERDDVDDYFEHIYLEISRMAKGNCRMLDFGGSWGELANYIEKRNPAWTVEVLDPNDRCNKYAMEKGLKVIHASSSDFLKNNLGKYDVIILNHIAEHMYNLKETLINLKNYLTEDGLIFFEIPDAEGYVEETAPPYMYLTYEHVVHMSNSDVRNLTEVTGYKICCMHKYYKKVSNYPSLCAILKPQKIIGNAIKLSDTEKYIRTYIDKSYKEIKRVVGNFSKLSDKFILWGIGASTTILLEAFGDERIFMLVDGNRSKQGLVYKVGKTEFKITAPEDIKAENIPILILSYAYKNSISKSIEDLGLKNRVYSLDEGFKE